MKTKLIYNHGDFSIEIENIEMGSNLETVAKQAKNLVEAFSDLGPRPSKKSAPIPVDGNKKTAILAWVEENPGHSATHVADRCGVQRPSARIRELQASGHLVRVESLYYSEGDGVKRSMAGGLYIAANAPTLDDDARVLLDWYSSLPDPYMGSKTLIHEAPLPRRRAEQALIFCMETKNWLTFETRKNGEKPSYKAVVVAPLV